MRTLLQAAYVEPVWHLWPLRGEVVSGTWVYIDELPRCLFCAGEGKVVPARFDFATRMGPWAYGCVMHWRLVRAADALGTGCGQLLIARRGRSDIEPSRAPEERYVRHVAGLCPECKGEVALVHDEDGIAYCNRCWWSED